MKVQGMVNPGSFTVEEIPGTKRSLVRLYQNVEACKIAKDAEDKGGEDRHFLRSRQADRKRVSGAHRHAQGRMNAPED